MHDSHWIETRFWTDHTMRALSVATRLVALYLMTGPDTKGPMGFRCSRKRVAEALDLSAVQVETACAALAALGIFTFDAQTDAYTVDRFLKQSSRQGRSLPFPRSKESSYGTL
jgi:hypothetical protein